MIFVTESNNCFEIATSVRLRLLSIWIALNKAQRLGLCPPKQSVTELLKRSIKHEMKLVLKRLLSEWSDMKIRCPSNSCTTGKQLYHMKVLRSNIVLNGRKLGFNPRR